MAVTTKNAFGRVLLLPDLLASISRYQDGVCHDMHPFLHVHIPRRHHVDRGIHISSLTLDDYNRIMTNDLDTIISSWLVAYGMFRLAKLIECLPFLHDTVLEYTAWSGNVVLLEWFQTTRHDNGLLLPWPSLLWIAVERNHLHVLEWMSTWGFRDVIPLHTMHAAIRPGNLRMIRYLHEEWDVPDNCGLKLMAHALLIHDADIIMYYLDHHISVGLPSVGLQRWLVANAARGGLHGLTLALLDRGFDKSSLSIDVAASGGSLPLVQHLHDLGTYICTTNAIDEASARGYIEMVAWLHTHRDEGCTNDAMDEASRNGHLDMVRWLHANRAFVHSNYPNAVIPHAMVHNADAMRAGQFHVVQFLRDRKLYGLTAKLEHLPFLHRHMQTPLDAIASSGNVQAAQ
ncbi:Aste57867_1368 [Aphanomyces stellatus]|uniref:Aste57867_1368 protein n=1 Tax=Aphanomyces stellatus TaxID=120398 RepID=A0A485K4Y6_9STRA|nr:hypothetical protein As57867_001367 [Aphanomyces stellatus]VFT78586.1 Aste57867_1368 [Aphanomyces stellatus]